MLIQERICNFAKTKNATTEKEMNNCLNCLTTLLLLCWNLLATNAKTDEMRTVTVNGATRAYCLYVPDKVTAPSSAGTESSRHRRSRCRQVTVPHDGGRPGRLHCRLSSRRGHLLPRLRLHASGMACYWRKQQ